MKTYIGIRELTDRQDQVRVRLFRMKKGTPTLLGESPYTSLCQSEQEVTSRLEKLACQLITKAENWGSRLYPASGSQAVETGVERAIRQLQAIIYYI